MYNDPPIDEDECPICHMGLPLSKDGTKTAAEAHIASCIESHMAESGHHANDKKVYAKRAAELEQTHKEENECPVCHTSLLSKEFDGNEGARQAHIASCLEKPERSSTSLPQYAPPTYDRPTNLRSGRLNKDAKDAKSFAASTRSDRDVKVGSSSYNSLTLQKQEDRNPTLLHICPSIILIVL